MKDMATPLAIALVGAALLWYQYGPGSVHFWVDELTGCHYVVKAGGGIAERWAADGSRIQGCRLDPRTPLWAVPQGNR